jgi:hypothetical protein
MWRIESKEFADANFATDLSPVLFRWSGGGEKEEGGSERSGRAI